jgi:hypothetical protein
VHKIGFINECLFLVATPFSKGFLLSDYSLLTQVTDMLKLFLRAGLQYIGLPAETTGYRFRKIIYASSIGHFKNNGFGPTCSFPCK